jgi:SPP1 family predicted phage head-tail adaptor
MAVTATGERNRRITLQQATVSTDDHGGDVEAWSDLGLRWAKILYGTGAERRTAAQTNGSQPATVRVLADPLTRTVTLSHRLLFDDAPWNILGIAPIDRAEIEFSVVRTT